MSRQDRVLSLYTLLFLMNSLSVCVLAAIASGGNGRLFWTCLAMGLIFSIAITVFMGHKQVTGTADIPSGKVIVNPWQTKSVVVNLPYRKAYKLCIQALNAMDASLVTQDQPLGLVEGKTLPSSWPNIFGELISLELYEINNQRTRIVVSSRPRFMKPDLFDAGKGYRNVQQVIAYITAGDNS